MNVSKYREHRKQRKIPTSATARKVKLVHNPNICENLAAPHHPSVVTQAENVVSDFIEQCQELSLSLFGLGAEVIPRYDWTWRSYKAVAPRSNGGIHSGRFRSIDLGESMSMGLSMSLRMTKYVPNAADLNSKNSSWKEYDSFQYSPFIGSRLDISPLDALRFLVAHEFAHCVQKAYPMLEKDDQDQMIEMTIDYEFDPDHEIGVASRFDMWAPHGSMWRMIYSNLRLHLGLNEIGTVPKQPEKSSTSCLHCGVEFTGGRLDRSGRAPKYCSASCRGKAYRESKKRTND